MLSDQTNAHNTCSNQAFQSTMASTSNVNHLNSGVGESAEVVSETEKLCVVCGDNAAKMHYGVLACLGCKIRVNVLTNRIYKMAEEELNFAWGPNRDKVAKKKSEISKDRRGFFRRALKKANQYECLKDSQCRINKYERNSCRSCRLKKCLDAGMDPNFVRPDRDFTGKQLGVRLPMLNRQKISGSSAEKSNKLVQEKYALESRSRTALLPLSHEGWIRKLPVEMRTMLMNLLNIEAKVARGDTDIDASEIYPLHISTIKEIIDEPVKLHGKRTEMRYEAHRLAKNEELSMIVYRRLIAAIDWVEFLSELMPGKLCTDDRIALVKSCFAPLMLFKCSAKTAVVTEKENLLCLCNFAYVPRNIAKAYSDTYHLDNGLVDRLLNELVTPFRRIHLTDEEIVCLSAIIVLNPMAKDLSEQGVQKINKLRDRIYDTLYVIIKESRPYSVPSSEFGNLLLYLPIVTGCANAMSENLRFAQTFSSLGGIPLLTSLFGCFPVEPFLEGELTQQIGLMLDGTTSKDTDIYLEAPQKTNSTQNLNLTGLCKDAETQTQEDGNTATAERGQKRRLPSHFTSPVENESLRDFRLFRPPSSYTLEEMFDDLNDDNTTTTTTSNLEATLNPWQEQKRQLSCQRRAMSNFQQSQKKTHFQHYSPSNWAATVHWSGPVQQANTIPEGHPALRPARSLHATTPPSNCPQKFEKRQNVEHFGLAPYQYYSDLSDSFTHHSNQYANYYLANGQSNDHQIHANLQEHRQPPSLGIPPIENLTFEHHN